MAINKRDPHYWLNPFAGIVLEPAHAAPAADERKTIEKEIVRLERCLEGMYTRRDRMLYTYGCMNGPKGSSAKEAARAKLEKTKAWRGLQFDIRYTERHIDMLTADLENLN